MPNLVKFTFVKSCHYAFEKAIREVAISYIKILQDNQFNFENQTMDDAIKLFPEGFGVKGTTKKKSNLKRRKGSHPRKPGRAPKGQRWSYNIGKWRCKEEYGSDWSSDESQ